MRCVVFKNNHKYNIWTERDWNDIHFYMKPWASAPHTARFIEITEELFNAFDSFKFGKRRQQHLYSLWLEGIDVYE